MFLSFGGPSRSFDPLTYVRNDGEAVGLWGGGRITVEGKKGVLVFGV